MTARTVYLSLVLAACIAAGTAGCRSAAPPAADLTDPATATFGAAPVPHPTAHLQPDVVIVRGGAKAIRGASADGQTWTIDGSAAGAPDLAVGRVMFMTSRAVGRVVGIDRRGPDMAVTLVPVRLTEVIKDADIRIDQELAPGSAIYQEGSQGQLTVRELAAVDVPQFVPARWQPPPAGGEQMPEARKLSYKGKVGPFEVEPYLSMTSRGNTNVNRVGVKIAAGTSSKFEMNGHSGSRGVKFGADVSLYGQQLTVHAVMPISNGTMGPGTTFLINGIERMDVGLLGGVENGTSDNFKVRVEVPIEVTVPIPPEVTDGVPLAMHFKTKFLVDFGFSGRNSSITAHGVYSLSGPIGIQAGKIVEPAMAVVQPMMEGIGGIPVGISGIVFAFEFRFLVGLGTADWQAGPYFKLISSFGISRGSALTMVNCTGLTIKVDLGGGVGLQASTPVADFLKKVLGADAKNKIEFEMLETMKTIVNNTKTQPDSVLCRGAR